MTRNATDEGSTATTTGDPIELNNLGNLLVRTGDHAQARMRYEEALELDPGYTLPLSNLAVLDQLEGKRLDAIERYRAYLALEPDDGEAHFNLGLLLQSDGKDASASFIEAAARLVTDTAERATNAGVACFFLGAFEKAGEHFGRALALDPGYTPALYHLGVLRLHEGAVPESIALLEAVLERDPRFPQAAENLGVALNTAGRPREALGLFTALVEDDPDNVTARLNLGYAQLDSGEVDDARGTFEDVIATVGSESHLGAKAGAGLAELADALGAP